LGFSYNIVAIPNFLAGSKFFSKSSIKIDSSGLDFILSKAKEYIFGSGLLIPTSAEIITSSKYKDMEYFYLI